MAHKEQYQRYYKNVRTDKHIDKKRWDRLCKWWLDTVETCEMQTMSEFAREFGVNGSQ
jgi:hypothetical protein